MILILGKNGAGKTYVANTLYNMGYNRSINYTTRAMREGEVNGIDYYFINRNEFIELIHDDFFIEYKVRKNDYYGTPLKNLSQNAILLAGDVQKIRDAIKEELILLYIDASVETRYRRINTRNDTIENNFNRMHDENFSYLYEFDGFFVNNDDKKVMDRILKILNYDASIVDKSNIISSKEFYKEEVRKFNTSNLNMNEVLLFLKHEEYILRKIMLEFDLGNSSLYSSVKDYYYSYIQEFSKSYSLKTSVQNDILSVKLNGDFFDIPFHETKIFRR